MSIFLVACDSTPQSSSVAAPPASVEGIDSGNETYESEEFSPIVDYSFLEFVINDIDIDVRSQDVSAETFTKEQGSLLTFDSQTKFSDSFSEIFDYSKAMELGKNPGLGVRDLHEQGIDGTSVNVAIVDQPLNAHSEYIETIIHHKDFNDFSRASMHGPFVASILVGDSVGVAPKAKLYYTAFKFPDSDLSPEDDYMLAFINAHLDAVEYLLNLNECLDAQDKISIISISAVGFAAYAPTRYEELMERAAEQNVWLFSGDEFARFFDITGMKPLGDADNTDDFIFDYNDLAEQIEGQVKNYVPNYSPPIERIYVPRDRRTTASPTGNDSYAHYVLGGVSSSIPYVAGVYALAKQVNPDITPEEFVQIARNTRYNIPKNDLLPDSAVPMINPVKIIEELQKKSN